MSRLNSRLQTYETSDYICYGSAAAAMLSQCGHLPDFRRQIHRLEFTSRHVSHVFPLWQQSSEIGVPGASVGSGHQLTYFEEKGVTTMFRTTSLAGILLTGALAALPAFPQEAGRSEASVQAF